MDGDPLASNIFWIGAINPFSKKVGEIFEEITGNLILF